jgi:ABC-type nitrate/sulfonate/bicarbonate transport system ATPase subunit
VLEFNFKFQIGDKGIMQAKGSLLGPSNSVKSLALLGPSGCGKSTFLKSLASLGPKEEGFCKWNNRELNHSYLQEGVLGFCFQSSPLLPHLNVLNNIRLPLDTLKKFSPLSEDLKNKKALSLLERAKLLDLKDRWPHDLSGGEKKRVALLRAFIFNPEILFLDEPFSELDAQNRDLFKQWLMELVSAHQGLILYVTHNEEDLSPLAEAKLAWPTQGNVLDFDKLQSVS